MRPRFRNFGSDKLSGGSFIVIERNRLKEWLLTVLEECGWKDQVKKDCLAYAKEHASTSKAESSSTTSKKPEDAKSSPMKDVSLDAMLKELLSKSKGMSRIYHDLFIFKITNIGLKFDLDAIPLHIKVEFLNRMRSFFQSKDASISASVASSASTHM